MGRKNAKIEEFDGKSYATRDTTRLLLGICRRNGCDVKIRISKKWITEGLVPKCSCCDKEFLVQTRDFDLEED